jgi:hypothetical protein
MAGLGGCKGEHLKHALGAATTFTRMVAIRIAAMPLECRGIAFRIAQHKLGEAIKDKTNDFVTHRELVHSQMNDIRELVEQISALGEDMGTRI